MIDDSEVRHTVRTTFTPGTPIVVGDIEYRELRKLGLLAPEPEPEPDPEPAAVPAPVPEPPPDVPAEPVTTPRRRRPPRK